VDFELGTDHAQVQAEARTLAAAVEPMAAEADALSTLHTGVAEALRNSGLTRLMVPAAYGGRFERVDPLAVCLAREAMMATSSHLDSLFALQGIGSYAIGVAGSPEQREQWLSRVAELEVIAALALTEPEAGSDLKAVTTTLEEAGGQLRLDGVKSFISNAGVAGFYTVLAREGTGHSLVLVPADADGLSTEPEAELIAPHILGTVRMSDVRLPASARIGPAGAGFDVVLATLAVFRVSVAGASVGLAQAALEEAARHATQREQFGRPLARLGPVAQLLADSWTEVEAARLLTYRAAWRARRDPLANLHHSSMAKLAASETAGRVVDRAVQIMGRWGLVRDARIERLYRQARPMRIYEGASEVLRLGIARALCEEVG
jgi:acyl-CoA dehydrogenase